MTMDLHWPLSERRTRVPHALLLCMVVVAASAVSTPALTQASGQTPGTVVAQAVSITPHLKAYAQVEPISALPLNAAETGVVSGLSAAPGTHVRAGERLAFLRGPSIESVLLQDQADLRGARAQLSAAQKSLTIQREQIRVHLSTRKQVHQATSAVAQAQATVDNAQSRLKAVREMASITAPAEGIVVALNSSNGELVSAGQPVVTIQPRQSLWLRASYYGANLDAIHTGMTGVFRPSDGSRPIPVRVRAISGVAGPGGGESVTMTPLCSGVQWLNGEFGAVTLNLPATKMVSVPTRALILNQGRWWVLVHTSHGNRPQEVVPGPVHGWNTYLVRGLVSGSQVVVKNAYLLFHASIAEQYQMPD